MSEDNPLALKPLPCVHPGCRRTIPPEKGIACAVHKEDAAVMIAAFDAGVPGINEERTRFAIPRLEGELGSGS